MEGKEDREVSRIEREIMRVRGEKWKEKERGGCVKV